MRTLDYIKLDSAAAAKVVESLQQLLADYQVFYANLRVNCLIPRCTIESWQNKLYIVTTVKEGKFPSLVIFSGFK